MRLVTLGKVCMTGCTFSRPKPLLLLSYLTLSGPQERRRLASLFWRGDDDKPGVQKKLAKLSVVLAQFKKEGAGAVFPSTPGLDPLPSQVGCDALEFLAAFERGALGEAVLLYGGPFLQGFDKHIPGLELSGELEDWLLETREALAQKAQRAMLELAEASLQKGQLSEARALAERAYSLEFAPDLEPQGLSRIQELFSRTESGVSGASRRQLDTGLDELPKRVRQVFLSLSLQETPNLTVLRHALKFSLNDFSEAHEDLIGAGLVTSEAELLAPELARRWLDTHPRDTLSLLLALARATPAEAAFSLYHHVYRQTQGFGGMGDFPRARAAYCKEAKALSDRLEFTRAADILADLHGVERVLEAAPDPESRFLEGYALERLGRYKEAMASLKPLPADAYDPNLSALKAVLLWRRGKSEEAKVAAEAVLGSDLDWLWARALAHNTLGGIAYAAENFLGAASYFTKAGSLFQACGDSHRWVGSLDNYATALDTMAEVEERRGADAATVERLRVQAEEGYKVALEALDQAGNNLGQRATTLMNIGMLWEYRKDWNRAETYYLEALPLAKNVKHIEARLQLNLGNAHFMRQNLSQAREHFHRAVTLSEQIGDSLVQATAVANLASMDKDPDSMEVALELLEQNHSSEQLTFFQQAYEEVLGVRLREALARDDAERIQILFAKLDVLYQKQGQVSRSRDVEKVRGMLSHMADPQQKQALLFSLFQNKSGVQVGTPN